MKAKSMTIGLERAKSLGLVIQKEIGWSYATSENAKDFGFEKAGCWNVSLVTNQGGRIEELAGFATKTEAIAYAADIDYPVSQWSK